MDNRKYNADIVSKMYDIIELLYILNRLTNEFYEEDYSKQYLLDMVDNMQNAKYNYDKYIGKDYDYNEYMPNYNYGRKKVSFIDKIIIYLKSLNEEY